MMGREVFVKHAVGSSAEYLSCGECAWVDSVPITTGIDNDIEIPRLFNSHDCTKFPKCDVTGCSRVAVYGFRRLVDTSTFDTTGFRSEPCNCCEAHVEETKLAYSGPNVKVVKLKQF
jgi:hypothetical protein